MELTQTGDRLLRLNQIIPALLPISKTSWWNGVKAGVYPKPVKLGPRTTAWKESDIMGVVQNGANERKEHNHAENK